MKARRAALVSLLLLIGVIAATVTAVPYVESLAAKRVLEHIKTLRPGISTDADVNSLIAESRTSRQWKEEESGGGTRRLTFRVENPSLYRLFLAPRTTFVAGVNLREGVVEQSDILISSRWALHGPGVSVANVSERIYPLFVSSDDGERMTVHLTREETEQQRACAFDLNVACLYRWGGCAHAKDIAPCFPQLASEMSLGSSKN